MHHPPAPFTEALFVKAKTWNQPKCPSMDEWIKKMWTHVLGLEELILLKWPYYPKQPTDLM